MVFSVKWFCFQAAYEIRMKIWLGSPIHTEQRKTHQDICIFNEQLSLKCTNYCTFPLFFLFEGCFVFTSFEFVAVHESRVGKTFSFLKNTYAYTRPELFFLSTRKNSVCTCTSFVRRVRIGVQNCLQLLLVRLKLAFVVDFLFRFLHTSYRHSLFIVFE